MPKTIKKAKAFVKNETVEIEQDYFLSGKKLGKNTYQRKPKFKEIY